MTSPLFTGPIAPYRNVPINPQNYAPSEFTITAITKGTTTTVTTAASPQGVKNNYVIGQLVRFVIPSFFGIQQLNEKTGYVIAIPGQNQVTINIDTSRNYDSFIPSPSYGPTPPQLLAIGDVNTGQINAIGRSSTGTFIPGSFINISPVFAG